MKNKNVNLGEGSVGKLLINLAVPAIIAQMVNLLYNIVDRIFIGRMANGEIAMAGIGVAMPIIMIISAFSYLIGSGGAPLTAIKMGEKNNDEDIVMALDCAKIERVLLNLLSNAIKFSYVDGIIYVNVNKKEENVIISIRDFGIGMSEKYLDKIFDRFIQVDNTMTRKNEGSGIGLSIVKSFVSLHNGSISVKSKENEGSEFVINLPINLIEDKELFLYDSEVLDFNIKTELSDIYM